MRYRVVTKGKVITTKVNEVEIEATSANDAVRKAESLFYYEVIKDPETEVCGKVESHIAKIKDFPSI